MPKICYTPKRFGSSALAHIQIANKILEEYQAQGLVLTLRQLYYQFVARDHIPNTFRSYKNLQAVINDARLAGLIDWSAMEDRTRNLSTWGGWSSPQSLLSVYGRQYQKRPWDNQPNYVEVWVEKDALLGIVEKACGEYRVPHFSCRGYTSQSELWEAARRIKDDGRPTTIIHLGDHDPSGVDMTRDIMDRLTLFGAHNCEVNRIALTMDQVDQYSPPPNPAKLTDSRCEGYMKLYGDESWELDALEPNVLINLINEHVTPLVDQREWKSSMLEEQRERNELLAIADRFDKVTAFLNRKPKKKK